LQVTVSPLITIVVVVMLRAGVVGGAGRLGRDSRDSQMPDLTLPAHSTTHWTSDLTDLSISENKSGAVVSSLPIDSEIQLLQLMVSLMIIRFPVPAFSFI
jgi:hypothetical protein